MIYAGGMKFLVLSAILYAPGTALYVWAKREQNKQVFTVVEWGYLYRRGDWRCRWYSRTRDRLHHYLANGGSNGEKQNPSRQLPSAFTPRSVNYAK